jgi:hypothetical protein
VDTIQQGSAKVTFTVSLTDPDGAPVDLTNAATCTFVFASPGGARTTHAGAVSGNPTAGVVAYTTAAGVLDEPGRWKVQVEVVFDDASEYFSAVGKFKVKANL